MQLKSYIQGYYSTTIFRSLLARQPKVSVRSVNGSATAPALHVHHQRAAQPKHCPKPTTGEVEQKVPGCYKCQRTLVLCWYCTNWTTGATTALCTQICYEVLPIISGNANKTYYAIPEY